MVSRRLHRILVILLSVSILNTSIAPALQTLPVQAAGSMTSGHSAWQQQNTVIITDGGFTPAQLTVTAGQSVTWTNQTQTTYVLKDGAPPANCAPANQIYLPLIAQQQPATTQTNQNPVSEPATGSDAALGSNFSETLAPGESFTFQYTATGTFRFYLENPCTVAGTVTVQAAPTATPTPSPTPTVIPTGTPTTIPVDAGWVTGKVFDTAGCDTHLTTCPPLAGVRITMARVDTAALAEARAMRQQLLRASNFSAPLHPSHDLQVTTPLGNEVLTKADGTFAYPIPDTGVYWLRAEKDGYTYAQRDLDVVKNRSVATNAIYLTPMDTAMTPCDASGCTHTNSDGSIQIDIPAGAIGSGETVDVTATNFKHVEYLPSGELPEDTWETYAFNLGGDSDFAFQPGQTATVRLRNDKGFARGTQIPLGYWNQSTQDWEHAGTGVVDGTGAWVVMEVAHFSNYDCNDPLAPLQGVGPDIEARSDDQESGCKAGEDGCFISIQDGTFEEMIDTPAVQVLGQEIAPTLIYNSSHVVINEVIDTKLSLDVGAGVQLGDHIGFELFVEGQKSESYTFESNLVTGEVGRYRYLWDGTDGQGNLPEPGVYDYEAKFSLPYRSEYCYALNGEFGAPPDCENGATGVFMDATEDIWTRGTVQLNPQMDSPYGAGWMMLGHQRLHENEAGQILITDGQRKDEFYFSGKDLLRPEQLNLARTASLIQAAGASSNPVIRIDGDFSPGAAPSMEVNASNSESLESTDQPAAPVAAPWENIAPFPVSILDNTAATFNGRVYSVGGYNGTNLFKFGYVYDPENNTWSPMADMGAVREKPSAAFIDGKLYVTGGWNNEFFNKTLEIYDPTGNSWRYAASMPEGRSAAPGVALDGKFYVIGGCTDNECNPSSTVLRYDPLTDVWSEIAPYPLPISWQACGAIAGQIYCAGGLTGTKDQGNAAATDHTYAYNPSVDEWVRLADMPQNQWGTSFTPADGKLYISGGVTNGFQTVTNESFVYDPATDRWQQFENANSALYRRASACGFYQFSGSTGEYTSHRQSAEVYPGLTNCDTEPTIYSRTATDYSTLSYDAGTDSYTRRYPDGTEVHFLGDGRHDFTLAPDGRKTVYSYRADGKLDSMGVVSPGGTTPGWVWAFVYNAGGKLQRITNPAGQQTAFTVDATGNLTQVSYPDTTKQQFAYDNRHLLTGHTDQNQQTTTHRYDGYGRIAEVTEAARPVYDPATGQSTNLQTVRSFTPSDSHYGFINNSVVGNPESPAPAVPTSSDLVDRVTYERGGRSGTTSRWGSWLETTNGIGWRTRYQRDNANNVTQITSPGNDCVEFNYDGRGNVIEYIQMESDQCNREDGDRLPELMQRWHYSYESRFNQIKTEIDPLGYTTTYIYDYEENAGSAGNLIRIEYPETALESGTFTPTMSFTYNALGLLDSMTDEAGIVTRYRYNANGLLTGMTENEGGLNLVTTFQDFDVAGRPQTVIYPRTNIYRYRYDAWGRVVSETDPLGVVTQYTYDSNGNLTRLIEDFTEDGTTGRNVVTEFTYDADDRMLSRQTGVDSFTYTDRYRYDVNGKLAGYSDSEEHNTSFDYDAADYLIGVSNPLSQSTSFKYDGFGNLYQATQADGGILHSFNNSFNNMVTLSPPGQHAHQFHYSKRNELTVYEPPYFDFSSTKTTYSYNALGQLTGVNRPDSKSIAYRYDTALRLKQVTQPRGTTTYSYNATTSQLTRITAPDGMTLGYGYDNEHLTSVNWGGSVAGSVQYGYDDFYRLTSLSVNNANPVAYQYDTSTYLTKAGALTINRLPQSRALDTTTLGQVADSYTYDDFGKLIRYQARAGNNVLYDVSYSYDALNRIATQTETIQGVTTSYAYDFDAVGRLVEVQANNVPVETYSYDTNGNRIRGPNNEQGSYDVQDRLTQYGATTYSYTANGELLTRTQNGQTTTYTYDVFSNLTDVALPGTGTLGGTVPGMTQIRYLIDGQDRRIGKQVDGILVQGFLYQDQLNPVAELDGSGNVVSRFIYGTSDHVPDYMVKGDVTYRIISDHLGSVHLVVNTADGTIAQRMNYDAFGRVTQDTSPGFQPFGFAGGIYDPDTGLVRFGARDYDAETGRWTTKDPIGFEGGSTNLYAYVGNNPVNWTDIIGLAVFICKRPADLIFPANLFDHYWIKTSTYESGMGPLGGEVPARDGNYDLPYDPVTTNDHTGQYQGDDSTCQIVPDADESCVDKMIKPGQDLGDFVPFVNDCRKFASQVIYECGGTWPMSSSPICSAKEGYCFIPRF